MGGAGVNVGAPGTCVAVTVGVRVRVAVGGAEVAVGVAGACATAGWLYGSMPPEVLTLCRR